MSERDFDQWRRSGEYLPAALRDFHDQKDLFKALDEVLERYNAKGESYSRINLSWIDAHKYTVDVFLWVMAGHGYTLQRSRQRFGFADLSAFVGAARKRWQDHSASILGLGLKAPGVKLPPQPDEAREGSQSPDDGRAPGIGQNPSETTTSNTERRV